MRSHGSFFGKSISWSACPEPAELFIIWSELGSADRYYVNEAHTDWLFLFSSVTMRCDKSCHVDWWSSTAISIVLFSFMLMLPIRVEMTRTHLPLPCCLTTSFCLCTLSPMFLFSLSHCLFKCLFCCSWWGVRFSSRRFLALSVLHRNYRHAIPECSLSSMCVFIKIVQPFNGCHFFII